MPNCSQIAGTRLVRLAGSRLSSCCGRRTGAGKWACLVGFSPSEVQENFGDQPLDLVIDDCSHMYEMTKSSLNTLLPRLREGGLYVIEDWGWAHWPDEYWQGSAHQMVDEQTSLSKLILELVMVVASQPGLISELTVRPGVVFLTRGEEPVSSEEFDISKRYVTAGRQMLFSR